MPRAACIVAAAFVLTLANAVKPLVVDDAAFVEVARQVAKSPVDPYGFELFWGDLSEPATQLLLPPLLPYWLAPVVATFGESPWLWKLWLLPFALALAFAVHRLAALLAPGLETPLVWMAVLSPGVLSGFNLMVDVPALALGLCGLAVFVEAARRERTQLAAVAGLLAGLAMQTKYSGATSALAMVAFGCWVGRIRLAVVAAVVAGLVFASWESFAALRYGEPHWWAMLRVPASGGDREWLHTALGLLSLIGALAPGAALLAWAGRASTTGLIAVAALLSLPFAWIPALSPPGTSQAYLPGGGALLGPELLPFAAAGLVGLGSLLAAASRRGAAPNAEVTSGRGLGGFVLAWLAIEIAAALFFSHFSFFAGRRVVGFSVVALLAAGHFASRTRPRPAHVAGVAIWAGALGCLYFAADCSDAYARRALVDHLLERIEVEQGSPAAGTVWFTGHWSLQHYASAAGMKPLVPGRSRIEAGDWLVVPRGVSRQAFRPPPDALEAIGVVSSVSALPWSTIPGSYIGAIPIRRQPVAHVSAQLFRSRYGFVARARAAENDRPRAGDGPR